MPRVMPRAHGLDDPQLADAHMAEVARAMGDTAQAKEMYEKYLAAEANGPFANAARARLVELTPPPPPPTTSPAPATIPSPRDAAVTVDQRRPADISAQPARTQDESHTVRNVLIVGITVAVLAGAVAIYAGTRRPALAFDDIDEEPVVHERCDLPADEVRLAGQRSRRRHGITRQLRATAQEP